MDDSQDYYSMEGTPAAVLVGPRTRLMGKQRSRPRDNFEAFAVAMSSITTLRACQVRPAQPGSTATGLLSACMDLLSSVSPKKAYSRRWKDHSAVNATIKTQPCCLRTSWHAQYTKASACSAATTHRHSPHRWLPQALLARLDAKLAPAGLAAVSDVDVKGLLQRLRVKPVADRLPRYPARIFL